MHRRSVSLYLVLAGIFFAGIFQTSPVLGQLGNSPDARFLAMAPELGDLVPDVQIVDDKGNPVNLRDVTQGHYTVLTLGCLT